MDQWTPEFLQPLNVITLLLVACFYLTIAAVLHRVVNYRQLVVRLNSLRKLCSAVRSVTSLQGMRNASPKFVDFLQQFQRNRTRDGLDQYLRSVAEPGWQADVWVDRLLRILISVAPMLGLAGTMYGLMLAFGQFADREQLPTLKELCPMIGVAIKTSLLGIACAFPCIVARSGCPTLELHDPECEALIRTWTDVLPEFTTFPR